MVKLLLWFFFCNLCPNFTFISCLVVITGSERKSFQSGGNALCCHQAKRPKCAPPPRAVDYFTIKGRSSYSFWVPLPKHPQRPSFLPTPWPIAESPYSKISTLFLI